MPLIDTAQSIPCYYEKETSPYGLASLFFCGRLVRDRFNQLNQYSSFNWVQTQDPIPEPISTPLAELIDRRANELLGNSITVQWSGGVDSTTLLLSLIKNGISKEDLVIFYDANSVREYPKLFSWLQDQKYQLRFVRNWRKALGHTGTDIITNGWCADQLFGSIFFHTHADKYFYSLDALLKSIKLPTQTVTQNQVDEAVEAFQQAGKTLFNLDISIAAELGWFINFCMKWTWVSKFNELYLLGTPSAHKTQVFYDTPYFQGWSLNNFPKIKDANIYGKTTVKYKKQLKQYCNEVFPDPDYLQNKTKNPSWNAAQTAAVVSDRRITIKTDSGYEVMLVPADMPIRCSRNFTDSFFTKFKK